MKRNEENTGPATIKPGWQTTEFYVTVLAALAPVMTLVFHREIDGEQVQAWATIAAALASGAYAISRSHSKQAVLKANSAERVPEDPEAPIAVASVSVPTSDTTSTTVPIEMLAHILARLDELTEAQKASQSLDTRTN